MKLKRIKGDRTQKIIKYSKKDWELIRKFNHYSDSIFVKDNCFKKKNCWAGCKYFTINEKAEVWRCYPAMRVGLPEEYLGNLLKDTFKLKKNSSPCLYNYCYCPDPIRFNMIK